jgi:hypothetical protein
MVDISNLAETPALNTLGDFFEFHVGNDDSPQDWLPAPAPIDVTVRSGEGINGSDRVTLIWADNAIQNRWLEVVVLGNDFTGLPSPDVHYWGNAIGETGNSSANALVNLSDVTLVRANQSGFNLVAIDNAFDLNRDQRVNVSDTTLVRANQSGFTSLQLITPLAMAPESAGVAEAPAGNPLLAGSLDPAASSDTWTVMRNWGRTATRRDTGKAPSAFGEPVPVVGELIRRLAHRHHPVQEWDAAELLLDDDLLYRLARDQAELSWLRTQSAD